MTDADGAVLINVELNVSDAERELTRLKNHILKTDQALTEKQLKKNALTKSLEESQRALAALQAKTKIIDGKFVYAPGDDKRILGLKAEVEKTKEELQKCNTEIEELNLSSDGAKLRFGAITKEAERLRKEQERIQKVQKMTDEAAAAEADGLKKLQQVANEAAAAAEEQRLRDMVASADVADQKIVDLNKRLSELNARKSELEKAGIGFGYAEYDDIEKEISDINRQLREYRANLTDVGEETDKVISKTDAMSAARKRMEKGVSRFASRTKEIIAGALFFNLISSGMRQMVTWTGKVIRTNSEATAAIAKLKGALLTLAQPLVEVIVPAFIALVNVLTKVVSVIARLISSLFGKTIQQSRDAAESLYNEAEALDGVGSAAKEAAGSLAGFDEINTITTENASSAGGASSGTKPDFDFAEMSGMWLEKTLGKAAGWVTAGLLLGGLALIAFGAAMGRLGLVLAGLLLIGTGISIGNETGVLKSWVETLGFDSVYEFLSTGLILGGLALIAIGAAMGNILMVLAGLGLIGAGVYVGLEHGEGTNWIEKLGLDKVSGWLSTALALAGIALIAIGASMGNILAVLAGIGFLVAGYALHAGVDEQTLKNWWEKLQLTRVEQWVAVAALLVGISLVAIGAAMGNILMVIAGAVLIGVGSGLSAGNQNLEDWVKVLGLEKIAGWVSGAILLGGMALIVFGIVTANILMALAGLGLLYAGFSVGTSSGTFKNWWEALGLQKVSSWVSTALKLGGIALIALGAATANLPFVIAGLGLLGVGVASSAASKRSGKFGSTSSGSFGGGSSRMAIPNMPSISPQSIPRLATGGVIPPNREFMAVLGDNKTETEVVSPLSTMKQAMLEALREAGGTGGDGTITVVVNLDGREVARNTVKHVNDMTRQAGKPVLLL